MIGLPDPSDFSIKEVVAGGGGFSQTDYNLPHSFHSPGFILWVALGFVMELRGGERRLSAPFCALVNYGG